MGLISQTCVQCMPWGCSACHGLWCSSTGLVCAAGVWHTQCGCAAGPMRDPPRAPCAPGTPTAPRPSMRSGAGRPGCAPRLPPPRICSQKGMSHGGRGAPHRAPRTAPRTAHLRGAPPMSGAAAPGCGGSATCRGRERADGERRRRGARRGTRCGTRCRARCGSSRPTPHPAPSPASITCAGLHGCGGAAGSAGGMREG